MKITLGSKLFAALLAMLIVSGGVSRGAEPSEQELIETLRTAEPADKAMACKKLAIYGTKECVADLAPLLADEQLASWARIALEAIPDAAADDALREAADQLSGRLLIGTINSIGVRKDAKAVEKLTERLNDPDAGVASAAAVALGHIGDDAAARALRAALATTEGEVRSAVAEGCVLCAERAMADDQFEEAVAIYDEVRKAEVPKPRILEATRGAILARKADGLPLLIEQLNSPDKGLFQIALMTARELEGAEVGDALASELARTTPERAALLLYALGDRPGATVPPAVLEAAKVGDKEVRTAAIAYIGRLGDDSSLDTLLEISTDSDPELAQAAKAALASLPGEKVNAEITALLPKAQGKVLPVLIELVGTRHIDATDALIKSLSNRDAAVRGAALTALGATVGPEDLSVLIDQTIAPKNTDDGQLAQKALREAALRMPDREATAKQLTAAMRRAPKAVKVSLLEILGRMGGEASLDTIAAAMKGNDDDLQDAGSRILGDWMNVDAGTVLLDLAKTSSSEKYRTRALRGYIRLARQFQMPDDQRVEMCQKALEAAKRPDEQKLVLVVLERYPSVGTLRVAVEAAEIPELKQDAQQSALTIVQKLGGNVGDARDLLEKIGLKPVKVEIIKAQYGSGDQQKDVTEVLQKLVGELPLIALPKPNYNEVFGGDPAPNTRKELKIQYKINGKAGEASFAENALIVLKTP